MNIEQLVGILGKHGFVLDQAKPIQNGVQLIFTNGSKISVYRTGNINIQGKHCDVVRRILKPYREAELRQLSPGLEWYGIEINGFKMPEHSEEEF